MVGEVISDEGVEQVLVAIEVRGGDRDELAVPGRCGAPRRPSQEVGFIGEQRRGHQQPRRIAGPGPIEDFRGRFVVAADHPADQVLDVIGHEGTIKVSPDAALTLR